METPSLAGNDSGREGRPDFGIPVCWIKDLSKLVHLRAARKTASDARTAT